MADYLQAAFAAKCENASQPARHYVVLVSSFQAYGGPEEGGWWYSVSELEAYKEYPTAELAENAASAVQQLADELSREARRDNCEYCLNSMEWLEARGLEADFLPEPDGPTEYSVYVTDELPTFNNSRPHYC